MGMDNRPPTPPELDVMRAGLRDALVAGAWGMSTGLVYPPGTYTITDEIVALAAASRPATRCMPRTSATRADALPEAIIEAVSIGEQSGARVQISHLKAAGRANHGRVTDAIRLIDAARTRGVDVHCDVYPYEAGSTLLSQVLPPWIHEGGSATMVERLGSPAVRARLRHEIQTGLPGWANYGGNGWHNIMVSRALDPSRGWTQGHRIADLAQRTNQDPLDLVADMLIRDRGGTVMIGFLMDPADVRRRSRMNTRRLAPTNWA